MTPLNILSRISSNDSATMASKGTIDIELPAYSASLEPPKPAHLPHASTHDTASSPVPSPSVPPNNPPSSPPRSKLSRLALPLSLLIGAAITASTTYALAKRVQHLIAHASVDSDPATWSSAARTQVYDPCYLGCADDCSSPDYAWNACQRTASLGPGWWCDANAMWNWAERYPPACLAAMGDVLRGEALKRLKQSYRNQLAVVILTVLAGAVGARVTYRLVRGCAGKREGKAALARVNPPPYREKAPRAGRRRRMKLLLAGFLGVFTRKAHAYACTGRAPSADQFFASPNGTVRGVVHGWFSNCYDTTYCDTTCSDSCDWKGSCSSSCSQSCYTVTYTDKDPARFVRDAARRVQGCGFLLVADGAAGGRTGTRVANARIERDWWVRISVNGYNVTRPDETDQMVLCLHDIGG